jgi:hypothetical protein
MTEETMRSGGCMCGAVRYEASGEPFSVAHCHCHSCRKHTGAPVVTLAGYLKDQVSFSGAERCFYESSPGALRAYCGECGSPLTWEGDGGDLGPIIELHLSTFDEPEQVVPTAHAFYPERLPWFDIVDDLPRYEGFADLSTMLGKGPQP